MFERLEDLERNGFGYAFVFICSVFVTLCLFLAYGLITDLVTGGETITTISRAMN